MPACTSRMAGRLCTNEGGRPTPRCPTPNPSRTRQHWLFHNVFPHPARRSRSHLERCRAALLVPAWFQRAKTHHDACERVSWMFFGFVRGCVRTTERIANGIRESGNHPAWYVSLHFLARCSRTPSPRASRPKIRTPKRAFRLASTSRASPALRARGLRPSATSSPRRRAAASPAAGRRGWITMTPPRLTP